MTTPTPPLSTALRTLREDFGISGNEAAKRAGLSQSKVSRAERGAFAPSPEDVAELCRVYRAPATVRRELMQMAQDLKEASHSARMTLQRGGWWMQERIGKIERTAARLREFSPSIVVGLVQTPDYIRALFGDSLPPEDLERTVQARLLRQDILTSGRTIDIVMAEGALRWCMGSPDIMAGQLAHLIDISQAGHVRLGIIPFTTPATVPALHPFAIYDSRAVLVGTINATALITDAQNLRDYEDYWTEIQDLITWGDGARTHLERIRHDFLQGA
uniref:helix-turn-helix domain-containing protein n=1 Tax=Amycolatopsis sp. CA-293810 TaxID=3239926 RepID=UPI003F492E41